MIESKVKNVKKELTEPNYFANVDALFKGNTYSNGVDSFISS